MKHRVFVYVDEDVLDFVRENVRDKRWNSMSHAFNEAMHWFRQFVEIQPAIFQEIGGKKHGEK